MTFGNPLGLLALAAIPVIVAIHLFRRRFRPHPVAGLFLYGTTSTPVAAGRRRERLLVRPSLLFELACVLALTWHLADPHFGASQRRVHTIVVLDSRVRMAALGDDGKTAWERGEAELRAQLEALARDDRVTLVASGSPPRILAGPAARPDRAIASLAAFEPSGAWHELDSALTLAADLARRDEARVVLVSDRPPAASQLTERLGLIARGQTRPTSGLTDARWVRSGKERVLARVLAYGGSPRTRPLRLVDAAGQVLQRRVVDLVPGRPVGVTFELEGEVPDTLTLTLEGEDPLASDDSATLVRPAPRLVRVAFGDGVPGPLTRALLLNPGVLRVSPSDPYDLLVLTRATSDTPPLPASGTWELHLVPGQASPVLGPFLAARGHELMRDLDFAGCVWAGAADPTRDPIPDGAVELLRAGDALLMSEERFGRERIVALHADLIRAPLIRHAVWPALVANLVEARRAALPGPRRTNLPLGQATTLTLPAGTRRATLTTPGGDAESGAALVADDQGVALVAGLSQTGQHALRGPDGASLGSLNGLMLDARLMDLVAASSETRATAAAGETDVARIRSAAEHLIPLVLAFFAAALAWWSFRREETRA